MVIPPEVLLVFRIVVAILGFLFFHMKVRIVLSRSVNNCVGKRQFMLAIIEQGEHSSIVGGNASWYNHFENQYVGFSENHK